MNFEKRIAVIFLIIVTPYWVRGIKGYITKTLFGAAKWGMDGFDSGADLCMIHCVDQMYSTFHTFSEGTFIFSY